MVQRTAVPVPPLAGVAVHAAEVTSRFGEGRGQSASSGLDPPRRGRQESSFSVASVMDEEVASAAGILTVWMARMPRYMRTNTVSVRRDLLRQIPTCRSVGGFHGPRRIRSSERVWRGAVSDLFDDCSVSGFGWRGTDTIRSSSWFRPVRRLAAPRSD